MTQQRVKWILLGVVPGIVLFTWMALGFQQQAKKIDDKALKDAPKGTDWLSYGMGWSEQRYSTMKQITPENVGKLALAWSYEVGPGNAAGSCSGVFTRKGGALSKQCAVDSSC